MKTIWKAALLAGAAQLVFAGAAYAQPVDDETEAQAANAAADDGDTMVDELLVTARRRSENLQDVPIAVTAYSQERLEQTGAQDITALQQSTPNLTLQVPRLQLHPLAFTRRRPA